jgi:hypothetical protein
MDTKISSRWSWMFWRNILLLYLVTWIPFFLRQIIITIDREHAIFSRDITFLWMFLAVTFVMILGRILGNDRIVRWMTIAIGAAGVSANVFLAVRLFLEDRGFFDAVTNAGIMELLITAIGIVALLLQQKSDLHVEKNGVIQEEARHLFLRFWIASNGVTWIPSVLGLVLWGLFEEDVFGGYESMAFIGVIVYGISGLVISGILGGIFIAFRNLRNIRGARYTFLVCAAIGAFGNIAYAVASVFSDQGGYGTPIIYGCIITILLIIFLIYGFRSAHYSRTAELPLLQTQDRVSNSMGRILKSRTFGIACMILAVGAIIFFGSRYLFLLQKDKTTETRGSAPAGVGQIANRSDYGKRFTIALPTNWTGGNVYNEALMQFGSDRGSEGWGFGAVELRDSLGATSPEEFSQSMHPLNLHSTIIENIERTTIDGHNAAIIDRSSPTWIGKPYKEVDAIIAYPSVMVVISFGTTQRTEWSGDYAVDWPTTRNRAVTSMQSFHWTGTSEQLIPTRYKDPENRFTMYNSSVEWTFQNNTAEPTTVLISGIHSIKSNGGSEVAKTFTVTGAIQWIPINFAVSASAYIDTLEPFGGENRIRDHQRNETIDLRKAVILQEDAPTESDQYGEHANSKFTAVIPYDDQYIIISITVTGNGYLTEVEYDILDAIKSFERIVL